MNTDDDEAPGRTPQEPVRLGLSIGDQLALFALTSVVGAGVGLALPWVARWIDDLPWVPFQGPLDLLASLDLGWGTAVGLGAGLVLGVALAVATVRDAASVTVAAEAVTVTRGGATRRVPRSTVSAVFLDGKRLVIIDQSSHEVVRQQIDVKHDRVEQAFRAHDYPWTGEDPHAGAFRRWVPDTPELPGPVNAVLAARETALRENDQEDAEDLRVGLMQQGYVVREEKSRQYWRQVS